MKPPLERAAEPLFKIFSTANNDDGGIECEALSKTNKYVVSMKGRSP